MIIYWIICILFYKMGIISCVFCMFFFYTIFLFSFAGVSFFLCLQKCASSWSCGIFGLLFLFFCVLSHIIVIVIDISCHDVSNERKKKSYIWSEINTVICKNVCFISNLGTQWREAELVLANRGQNYWKFKKLVFLGHLTAPTGLQCQLGSTSLWGCALSQIQVQLELNIPSLYWFNRTLSRKHSVETRCETAEIIRSGRCGTYKNIPNHNYIQKFLNLLFICRHISYNYDQTPIK